MTLEQFCKKAGCVVSLRENSEGYDGPWMYHSVDSPNVRYCGYKTEQAAYKGFLEGAYGKTAAKAIVLLLNKSTNNARSRPESTPPSGESHEDSLKSSDEDLMRRALHALRYRGMSPWKVIQPVVKDLEERLK